MDISVIGLGYVGTATAACLAQDGHAVHGVDISARKVQMLNDGRSPIVEEGLGEMIQEAVETGNLEASDDLSRAVDQSDLGIICVGTPSGPGGAVDLASIRRVAEQLGEALQRRTRGPFHIVLRSTVLPGTTRDEFVPRVERHAGQGEGRGFNVYYHPEFMREGKSVEDYYDPPQIIVGEYGSASGEVVLQLYEAIDAPKHITEIEVAEAVKYVSNAFHALKISFANEVGRFCKGRDVDGREVMRLMCEDRKLNISPRYLKPGFAFGGSCLPKDLRAFVAAAQEDNLDIPVISSVLPSNQRHIEEVLDQVLAGSPESVGLIGLSFKPGTDDLRESPFVALAERLLGKGIVLAIYDEEVWESRLMGGNKAYVERHLPHLGDLLVRSLSEVSRCDCVVVGHPVEKRWIEGWLSKGKRVLDLVGSGRGIESRGYTGVAW